MGEREASGGELRVSAFEVSDPTAPHRRDRLGLGKGSRSIRDGDSRQAVYLTEARTLVLPTFVREGKRWYVAVLGVRVAEDGTLTRAGRWLPAPTSRRAWSSSKFKYPELVVLSDSRVAVVIGDKLTVLDAPGLTVRAEATLARPTN